MNEQDTIARIQGGDKAAFEAVVEEHKAALYGYLRARVAQPADADDLLQEAFMRFYAGRSHFEPGRSLRPWLIGIARNLLREYVRHRKKRPETAWTELCLELDALRPSHDDKEGPLDDALEYLPGCLQQLGDSAREAINLRYRAHMKLAKIGEKLRRSEGAVKLLMFRARQSLKNCLDAKCETPAD